MHTVFFFCIVFENNKNSVIWVWVLLYVLHVREGGEFIITTCLQTLHILDMGKKQQPISSYMELVYQNWTSYMLTVSGYLLYVCRGDAA